MTESECLYYVLDAEHRPVAISDVAQWAEFMGGPGRIVAQTHIGNVFISTVCLGINHRFCQQGPPLIFETMIFEDGNGGDCWRYASWDDAVTGHAVAVKKNERQGMTNNDDKCAELALRGLRLVRDAAVADDKIVAAEIFGELISALETGGDHPLLRRWLDLRHGALVADVSKSETLDDWLAKHPEHKP
jgi:hypothetical protein